MVQLQQASLYFTYIQTKTGEPYTTQMLYNIGTDCTNMFTNTLRNMFTNTYYANQENICETLFIGLRKFLLGISWLS